MLDRTNKYDQYCTNHTSAPTDTLIQLERETYLKTLAPQMLSGTLQGQLLRMISLILKPKHILEIGTFTGYAALCLADGLAPGGKLTTIEINPELSYISNKYFSLPEYRDKIVPLVGDALKVIPTLSDTYDLIFLDATKKLYGNYYDLIISKLNKGGILLADNVLWSGKVLQPSNDRETNKLDQFNKHILQDDRVENIILPIRDGINLIRKL